MSELTDLRIVVACHKSDPAIRQDEIYMPVQVGKAIHPDIDLGFQDDNTGDNISEKNGSYCELTALYWAWKNLSDVEYIGLAHYRRYFDLSTSKMLSILKEGKTIISKEYVSSISNFDKLASFINLEEAYILVDTILSLYPEMKSSVVDYLFNSNKYSVFNMIVTDRKTFDRYCSFIFSTLDKVSERLLPGSYSRTKRNIGYMAEILLGLWLRHNKVDCVKVNTIVSDKRTDSIKIRIRNLVRSLSFRMNNISRRKSVPVYDAVRVGLKNDGIILNNI